MGKNPGYEAAQSYRESLHLVVPKLIQSWLADLQAV